MGDFWTTFFDTGKSEGEFPEKKWASWDFRKSVLFWIFRRAIGFCDRYGKCESILPENQNPHGADRKARKDRRGIDRRILQKILPRTSRFFGRSGDRPSLLVRKKTEKNGFICAKC